MSILTLLGDYYHSHDLVLAFIKEVLNDKELTDISSDSLSEELKKQPELFILSKENRTTPEEDDVKPWLTPQLDQELWDYVSNGGNLLILHGGLSAYPEDSRMRQLAKGHFLHHPEEHLDVMYEGTTPESEAIFFHFLDEHYFVDVDEEETNVFLRSKSSEGKQIAGWRHTIGEGKVLCLTPTHRKEGFEDETFKKLFKQSVEWLCD